jgi:ADP-ribose pyrophosphatase YjhB (NUDIX family)
VSPPQDEPLTQGATPFLGAGALITDDAGALLLVVETGPGKQGKWSLPAGKVESGESAIAAMVREVREETGLTVDPIDIVGFYHSLSTSEGYYGINVLFRARVVEGEPTPTTEHPEVRFVDRAEIAVMTSNGHFRSGELVELILADVDAHRSLPLSTIRTLGSV